MVVSGSAIDSALTFALASLSGLVVFVLLRRSAKVATVFWIAVLCFVPIWIGISLGFGGNFFVPVVSIAAALVFLSLIPFKSFHFRIIDGLVLLLLLVSIAALLIGNARIGLFFLSTFLVYFTVGYLLGRGLPLKVDVQWIYGAIAVSFTIVAILAVIEFVTQWNPFVQFSANNSLFTLWGSLQERGGVLRAEGAFGHSIALSSSLAIAVPLTLASRFRFLFRIMMVLVMLLATVLTFSRIGMIGALLGLALSVLFLRESFPLRGRVVLTTAVTIVSLSLVPIVATIFTDAGTEASKSAAYRGDLFSLVSDMNLVGLSDSVRSTSDGQTYFGNYKSIDSQLIFSGLSSGLLALALVVIALLGAMLLVLRRRASAATIAVVAQIPALVTVALITQYSIFLWFVVGLAVAAQHGLDGPNLKLKEDHFLSTNQKVNSKVAVTPFLAVDPKSLRSHEGQT